MKILYMSHKCVKICLTVNFVFLMIFINNKQKKYKPIPFSVSGESSFRVNLNYYIMRVSQQGYRLALFILIFYFKRKKQFFRFQIIAITKLVIYEFMSFATYYMHLIFGRIPSPMSSDLILYILPALTILILFFSLKIMFFKNPKLRKVK